MKIADFNADVKLEHGKKFVMRESDDDGKILTREYLFSLIHSFLIISTLGYGYHAFLHLSHEYGLKCLFYGVMGAMSFFKTRKIYFLMHLFYIFFYGGFGIYYLCNLRNVDITNDVLVLASAFYAVVFLAINYLMLFLICKAHDILLKDSK